MWKISRIITFLFLLSLSSVQLNAQVLEAKNDAIKTGPSQRVRYDVTSNDVIPCSTYTLEVVSITPPSGGTAAFDGDFIVFTPAAGVFNTTVNVVYKLTCKSGGSVQATVTITVQDTNLPVNIIQTDEACITQMPKNVSFGVQNKYVAKPSTSGYLQMFHIPLVGDLNGDGKPEIISPSVSAMGTLTTKITHIYIFDGQTGAEVYKFKLSDLGTGYGDFQLGSLPYHQSPSYLAIADVDNDGIGEIIVCQSTNDGKVYALKPTLDANKKIIGLTKMWDGEYGHKAPLSPTGNSYEVYGQPIPNIVDINGDGIPELVVYNKIYNAQTGKLLMAWSGQATTPEASTLTSGAGLVNYNPGNVTTNGGYSSNLKTYALVGRRPSNSSLYNDLHIAVPAIVDIDGDGIMEIVTGARIHKFNLTYLGKSGESGNHTQNTYTTVEGPSSVTVPTSTGSTTTTYFFNDGFTRVADLDGDGKLEAVVFQNASGEPLNLTVLVYIWDLETGALKAASSFYTNGNHGTFGIPFVGDINDRLDGRDAPGAFTKKLPEICVIAGRVALTRSGRTGMAYHSASNMTNAQTGNNMILGITYDGGEANVEDRLKVSWVLEHEDTSDNTGITMFDFNNDGAFDLCYRDENTLRVISPKLGTTDYIHHTDVPVGESGTTNPGILFKTKVDSETGFEAPAIADVNMDGSADIIVAGYHANGYYANVYVFERKTGSPMWAPCPPVWNQALYNPLYINEDLTVPAKPISMLTEFMNGDGQTVRPYNGAWIQQPIVKAGDPYVPVYRHPDAVLTNMRVEKVGASQTKVILTIRNDGLASINANTPIYFYMTTDLSTKSNESVQTVGVDIFQNEKVTLEYILNANSTGKFVHCRLVDDGTNFPATGFTDCNITNNYGYTSVIRAVDDYFLVVEEMEMKFNIVGNDTVIGTPKPEIYEGPKHGTASIGSDGKLSYIPNQNALGIDTIVYILKCEYNGTTLASVDTAYVYIQIAEKPDNISDAECYVNPPASVFSIKQLAVSEPTDVVFSVGTPLVGDIDNDSIVEIVVAGGIYPNNYSSTLLRIFEVRNNQLVLQQTISTPYMLGGTGAPFAFAKVDGDDYAAIFLCTRNASNIAADQMQLIKYVFDGTSYVEQKRISYSSIASKEGGIPYITDFNGDGRAEVVVLDKVFDAQTLTLLADGNLLSNASMGFGLGAFPHPTNIYGSYMAVGDMDGDGLPEVIGGNCVYKVKITNTTGLTGNSFSLWSKCDGTGPGGESHGDVGDGCTAIADMDGDGFLDVIVTVKGSVNSLSNNGSVYIWNPRTKKVMHTNVINSIPVVNIAQGPSAPFVGDIDNDGMPEICLTSQKIMYAFDYDSNTKILKIKWSQTTSDASACTTMSMFDFNQDGSAELVYRDETHLRILSGNTGNDTVLKIPLTSGTVNEYPVIADVNNDGSAEIIVTGCTSGYVNGRLWIYSSDPPGRWAPARKVWNQVAYNAVNINEDLTVPKIPLSPAAVFPGDGVTGNVRPYNAFLQQQTTLNKNGTPLWLAANGQMVDSPSFHYDVKADSMVITVKVKNEGNAAFQNPFYVSVYKDNVGSTSSYTYKYENVIMQGDSAEITFGIGDFKKDWYPFDNIAIRINDNGNGYNDQLVCDSTYRDYKSSNIIASDDYLLAFNDITNEIKVLVNDIIPDNCTPVIVIVNQPNKGSAVLNGSVIEYTSNIDYIGTDTLTYLIHCGDISVADTATVYINVVKRPDNIDDPNCYMEPTGFEWDIKESYRSPSGDHHTYAIPLVGDIDGDGIPEVVTLNYKTQYLNILWGRDKTITNIKMQVGATQEHQAGGSISPYTMFKTTINGVEKSLIVVKGSAGNNIFNLYAYDLNGPADQSASPLWVATGGKYRENVSVADFDGDGIPEIYISNRIYNANTGKLLVAGTGNAGRGHHESYFSMAADVNNDGKLELIVGSEVYAVNIPDKTTDAPENTLTLIAKLQEELKFSNNVLAMDGTSVVADINQDGKLDVIYLAWNNEAESNGQRMLVAWDVESQSVICKTDEFPNYKGTGIPFVGNIDDDPELEVVFMIKDELVGYKPDFVSKKFVKAYSTVVADESGNTGMTIFDFNQNNVGEIVYRDETKLRIMRAEPGNPGTFKNIKESLIDCSSATAFEYPVVADVDNDGAAEIIVIGNTGSYTSNGFLWIFKSGTADSWAPARKVWNQYAYNAVNINEDLTVPKIQFNPATIFPGNDGVLGTGDDVQPFNAFLQQQTRLDINGIPIWLTPNGQIADSPAFNYDVIADSMVITVKVKNTGDAAFQNPFYVTVYHDNIGQIPNYTYKYENTILQGDSAEITFGIGDFKKDWYPFDNIAIRINDNGNGYNHQLVCDSTYRDYKSSNIIASDDHMLMFKESANNQLKVADNDILPAACTNLTVALLSTPAYTGTATVNGTVIEYTPATGETADTLRYLIHCGDVTKADTAMVYITIVEMPDNITEGDCWVYPQKKEWDIQRYQQVGDVATTTAFVVGDMNDDGYPDIVAYGNKNRTSIKIFWGPEFTTVKEFTGLACDGNTTLAIGRVKVEDTPVDKYESLIFYRTGTTLRAIRIDGTSPWSSNPNSRYPGMIGLADFNGDGWSEVYLGNQIYDAATGKILCDGGTAENSGISRLVQTNVAQPIAINIMGDANLEFVAGNKIYEVDIDRTTASPKALTLLSSVNPPANCPNDGITIVADFDNDGQLEVLVRRKQYDNNISGNVHLYLWSPHTGTSTGELLASEIDVHTYLGVPFAGDVDGDGRAEIVTLGSNGVYIKQKGFKARRYNENSKSFDPVWDLDHMDQSGATGMTLFDFNNDGISEIVYRDENELRIINVSGKSHITGADTLATYTIESFTSYSETFLEYPIVVDIYGNQSSAILVTSDREGPRNTGAGSSNGYEGNAKIDIFTSVSWAPARKVWNQYAYNPVNVNKDLTIPKNPLNIATVFPGDDGQLGTSKDVRPYNNFLQQQTLLSKNGTPLWLVPDYVLDGATSSTYHAAGDSLVISFCVKNTGNADGVAPFYASVYSGSIALGNAVAVASYPTVPQAGGASVCYSIKIPNLSSITSNVLILSINDKGEATYVTPECNYSPGQEEAFDKSNMIFAENDFATVFICDEVIIPILTNDKFSGSAFTIIDGPKYGTITPIGSQLTYKNTGGMGLACEQTGNRVDTITYEISSVSSTSTAKVFVHILSAPGMVMEGACSVSPRIALTNNYSDMVYTWERSADGTAGWQEVSSSTDVKLNITEPGFYRVTIKYNDNKSYKMSKGVEVVLNRKVTLPGGVIWYDMSYSVVNISWL